MRCIRRNALGLLCVKRAVKRHRLVVAEHDFCVRIVVLQALCIVCRVDKDATVKEGCVKVILERAVAFAHGVDRRRHGVVVGRPEPTHGCDDGGRRLIVLPDLDAVHAEARRARRELPMRRL